jgi:Tfp pilus assembly protein PilO
MALIFIVFIAFIYSPMKRELKKTRAEYESIEKEIASIKTSAGEGRSLDEIISALKSRLTELEKKFPEKEELILRDISGKAKQFNIELNNMSPDKKRAVTDIECAVLAKKGYVLQEMAITVNMKTDFKTFAEFMKSLKDDFPFYLKLDSVRLVKLSGGDRHPMLDIELKLRAYLISQS